MFCLPPREQVGTAGLCVQGLGGNCSELVLQVWSSECELPLIGEPQDSTTGELKAKGGAEGP